VSAKISVVIGLLALVTWPFVAHAGPDVQVDARDAGAATITEVDNPNTLLTEGESETPFSLRLPEGAECPGDSKSDQWRVESFVIPAVDDPADIVFESFSLAADTHWPLLGVDSTKFLAQFMPENPAPGLPGQIPDLPAFSFELYGRNQLPEGRYKLGIACSYYNQIGPFWATEIDILYDSEDQSSDFQWQVVRPPADANANGAQDSSSSSLWVVAVGAAAVGAILLLLRHRNSRRHVPSN
jgi:hypothetical protein